MKECCRTGDEQPSPNKPWLKWLLYLAIVMALGLVVFEQITS